MADKEKTKVLYLNDKNLQTVADVFANDEALSEKSIELTKKRIKKGVILSLIPGINAFLILTPMYFGTFKFVQGLEALEGKKYNPFVKWFLLFLPGLPWGFLRASLAKIGIGANKMYERMVVPADYSM